MSLLQVVCKRLHDAKDIVISDIYFWVQNIEGPKKIHDEKGRIGMKNDEKYKMCSFIGDS